MVGFQGASIGHAAQGLDAWLEPFLAALGHKKRRTDLGAALLVWAARSERAQEPAADGGQLRSVRARPAAALYCQPGLK
jgi:hypothetical protein